MLIYPIKEKIPFKRVFCFSSPKMSRRGGGARGSFRSTKVTVAHVEYIMDITPSQDFEMQIDQAINPGMPFLFPWLSEMAKMFETYRIIKLVFFFKSTSADAVLSTMAPSGSTSLGSVIMMAQYNVLLPPPVNKRDMLNNATAVSCKPSNSMSFTVNPHASYKTLFVRTPFTPTGGDRRLYDHADFHLATEGMQATDGSIGELSVMAVMQFAKPTLVNNIVPFDSFIWTLPYTPAVGGNSLHLMRFTQTTLATTLKPIQGSSLNGYLFQDPNTGIYNYYFGDSADDQLGCIYEITLNAKLAFTGAAATAMFYLMSHPDVSAPANVVYFNCAHVGFLSNPGLGNTDLVQPGTLTSVVITPAPTTIPVTESDEEGISFTWYVQVTGPDAYFGIDNNVAANICNFRWFTSATGLPVAGPGAPTTNHLFKRWLTVAQVSPQDP